MIKAVAGHPYCAEKWITSICVDVCKDLGLEYYYNQINNIDNPYLFFTSNDISFVASIKSAYPKIKSLKAYKVIHIINDARELIVSAYHNILKAEDDPDWYPPKVLKGKLQKMSLEDGLVEVMNFLDEDIRNISQWKYDDPNVFEIKYHELANNPVDTLAKAFDFLDLYDSQLDYSAGNKSKSFLNRMFINLGMRDYSLKTTKLSKGYLETLTNKVDIKSLKLYEGTWKDYFTEDHKTLFKEKYSDVLLNTGYETDHSW